LTSVNVADSLAESRLAPLARWALLAAATLLAASAVVILSFVAQRARRAPPTAPVTQLAPTAAMASSASSEPTGAGALPLATRRPARVVTPVPQPTPLPTPPERPLAPVWAIPRLDAPPLLDGRLDEWSGPALQIDNIVFGHGFWHGPEDLSAHAYGGWTADALYLAVRVVDDVFSQPASGAQLHLGDSVELQLDVDLTGDWDSAEYNDDDWQIGISPGDFAARPPEAFVWRPFVGPAEGVRVASQRLADGYTLEIELPWALVGFDPLRTAGLGLALNVSDNDDPRPAQLTMISSAPARSWSDPRTFGTLVLLPGSE